MGAAAAGLGVCPAGFFHGFGWVLVLMRVWKSKKGALVLFAALAVALACFWPRESEPSAVVADDARTIYPIVLAHGLTGFDHIGPLEYFRGIPQRLRAHGATVFVTQVSAFNASEVRGEQLLAQVEAIVRQTGARKVNLIGHSQGGHSVRYVAAKRPDLVASVTVVASPVMGSEAADAFAGWHGTHPWAYAAMLAWARGQAAFTDWATGNPLPQDPVAALASLTTIGTADFNRRFPAGVPVQPCGEGAHEAQGIRYYSWSGVGSFYRALNPSDYLMALTQKTFHKEVSDGLVGRCASHLGQVIRDDYPMNHFHAVNLFFGAVSPDVDPVQLYVDQAKRLKLAGL